MRIVSLDEVRSVTDDKNAVVQAVKDSVIAHARGQVSLPSPTQMVFLDECRQIRGDCHVKSAYSDAYPYFCVKIATGFYNNATLGLPVNDGLVMLLSSETGTPLAMFQDGGHMTSVRTAAAGALAADLVSCAAKQCLGIVGTGHQAELQTRWITELATISEVMIWGRARAKADDLVERLSGLSVKMSVVETSAELCERADIIVTATPSTQPIIAATSIRDGHRIVALGADSPGKIELEPEIIARAAHVITDDHEQCLRHGEYGHAVRAGLVSDNIDVPLGACLADPGRLDSTPDAIVVVDLTGLGVQDLAIAELVWSRIGA